jgi:hypothetical protein
MWMMNPSLVDLYCRWLICINVSISFTGDGLPAVLDTSSEGIEDHVKADGASSRKLTTTPIVGGQLGGLTAKTPGIYTLATATYFNGVLTLDANGVTDPEWTFLVQGALTVGAGASIEFIGTGAGTKGPVLIKSISAITIGGAARLSSANSTLLASGQDIEGLVTMQASGSISVGADAQTDNLLQGPGIGFIFVGANSIVNGQMKSRGAITVSANCVIKGQIKTNSGAITVGAGASTCALCSRVIVNRPFASTSVGNGTASCNLPTGWIECDDWYWGSSTLASLSYRGACMCPPPPLDQRFRDAFAAFVIDADFTTALQIWEAFKNSTLYSGIYNAIW